MKYLGLGTISHVSLGFFLQDHFVGLGRAIVIGPEPIIQWDYWFPIIALEEAVMQVMETVTFRYLEVSLEKQLLEPICPKAGGSALSWAFISMWMGCEGTIQ